MKATHTSIINCIILLIFFATAHGFIAYNTPQLANAPYHDTFEWIFYVLFTSGIISGYLLGRYLFIDEIIGIIFTLVKIFALMTLVVWGLVEKNVSFAYLYTSGLACLVGYLYRIQSKIIEWKKSRTLKTAQNTGGIAIMSYFFFLFYTGSFFYAKSSPGYHNFFR